MSGWRKFGVALYCSTTLAATAVVGFALFIGATPSKINLFDKNRDIRNWVFIAAAVSLACIALSAFTMFCILTTAKKSDLKRVRIDPVTGNLQQKSKIADDSNSLLHSNSSIKPTVSSQQLDDKGSTWDTKKDTNQINNGCGNIDIRYNQTDSLPSDILNHIQLSQLQVDAPSSEFVDDSYKKSRQKTNDNSDWKMTMKVPEHIYVGM
ncbi:MAG: hypothetical protein U0X86_000858 [Wolbachia endosymbiont of Xenopsylla cheopis]